MHRNKGTPVAIINSDGGQTMCSSEVDRNNDLHISTLDPHWLYRSVQLDMRGTTARSASAICFLQSFAVDHTKHTEALFIAHSSTAQKATFIRVNNRSLKLHVFIIKWEFTQNENDSRRSNRILIEWVKWQLPAFGLFQVVCFWNSNKMTVYLNLRWNQLLSG